MGTTENFCLRWNDFEANLSSAFRELRDDADFFDVTLATDEDEVKAHKVVLSACSPHLKQVLKRHSKGENQAHLLIYLRGVRHADLVSVLEFMYSGEVNVSQEDLNSFLAVAEDLRVRGLTQNLAKKVDKDNTSSSSPVSASNGGSTKRPRPPGGISVKSLNSLAKKPKPGVNSNKTDGEAKSELSQDRDGEASTGSGASNQQLVVTPDVAQFGKDDEDEDGTGDDGGFDESADGFEFAAVYGDTSGNDLGALDGAGTSSGGDGKDDNLPLLDPAGLAGIVVPTSDEDAERDLIASEITSFLVSMTLKKEDGRYQCLICARESRDLYNQRQHILTHMAKDGTFAQRLNNYARRFMIEHNSKSFTCLKCRATFNKEFYYMRNHFVFKHLKDIGPIDM